MQKNLKSDNGVKSYKKKIIFSFFYFFIFFNFFLIFFLIFHFFVLFFHLFHVLIFFSLGLGSGASKKRIVAIATIGIY